MQNRTLNKLLRNLGSPRDDRRRKAAEDLRQADERALYPLIKALRDSNVGVQDAAMRSLMAIGGETTAYMVLPLLREDSFLRNTALLILKETGPVAVPLLRPYLHDKDDDIRKFVLDLVVDIDFCPYLDVVEEVLQTDRNANVRASAAKALGHFRHNLATPSLIAALNDEEWVAFSALESLAAIKDENTVTAVAALLSSPLPTLRYAAIETLGEMGFPASAIFLHKIFPITEGMEKTALLHSLLKLGEAPKFPEVPRMLIQMFQESSWDDRLIILKGLASLKVEESLPMLLDAAGGLDRDIAAEMDIITTVKRLVGEFASAEHLIALLKNPETRFRSKTIAIEIIEENGYREAIPSLLSLMGGAARDVKRASMDTLCTLADDDTEGVLLRALGDDDGHVRRSAVCALRKIGERSLVKKLLGMLLQEPYLDVREEMVRAVLAWEPENALAYFSASGDEVKILVAGVTDNLQLLSHLSRDENLEVRLAAINGLGRLASDEARQMLAAFLGDANPEIRKSSLRGLGEQGIDTAMLQPLLHDSDMWVRVFAVRYLGRSGNNEAVKLIAPLLAAGELPVVMAALDALNELAAGSGVDISSVIKPCLKHKVASVKTKAQQILGGKV